MSIINVGRAKCELNAQVLVINLINYLRNRVLIIYFFFLLFSGVG